MKRSLSLKRETLADLTTDELTAVAGGDATGGCPYRTSGGCPTTPIAYCLSLGPTCWDTLDQ